MTDNLDRLKDWIGRKETRRDTATAWPVAALSGNLAADGSKIELWTANAAGNYAVTGTASLV